MTRTLFLLAALLIQGCSSLHSGKSCGLSPADRQQALTSIQGALKAVNFIRPEQYLSDKFTTHGEFDSKEYCTFLVKPWQPIVSEFLWDGTLAFRVSKKTLQVEDYFRVDEG